MTQKCEMWKTSEEVLRPVRLKTMFWYDSNINITIMRTGLQCTVHVYTVQHTWVWGLGQSSPLCSPYRTSACPAQRRCRSLNTQGANVSTGAHEGPQCGDDNAEYITYEQDEGKISEGPQCGDYNAEQDLHRCPGLSQLQHPHLYRETMWFLS